MSEATISFADHDQIRTLFGARDEFLHRVRDSIGIDVVVRGDELRLRGDQSRIERGLKVFHELRAIVEKQGQLQATEVSRVLADEPTGNQAASAMTIDLFDPDRHHVGPRSAGQREYVQAIEQNELVFCTGPAGCGKTYLAVAMAIQALRREEVRRIVLVRPAVEAGEKLGFLPGDIFAKVNPYLRPLLDALNDLLSFETVQRYLDKDVIEIVPLAFMRGRTLNDTFIILDEGQNTTVTQMKMFLTRMGERSRIVVTGDVTQIDLPEHLGSGLVDAVARLADVQGAAAVEMTGRDIVRHRLVKEIVRAYDRPSTGRGARSTRRAN